MSHDDNHYITLHYSISCVLESKRSWDVFECWNSISIFPYFPYAIPQYSFPLIFVSLQHKEYGETLILIVLLHNENVGFTISE